MSTKNLKDVSFFGVSIFLILTGALIFVFGLMAWYLTGVSGMTVMAFPFFKVIGGLIIIALGYVVLELELLRKK
jgi:hypothetical protein